MVCRELLAQQSEALRADVNAFAASLQGDESIGGKPQQMAALRARFDALVVAEGQLSRPAAGQGSLGRAASVGSEGAALLGATSAAATGVSAAPTDSLAGRATRCSAGAALPEVAVAADVSCKAAEALVAEVRRWAGQALAAQRGLSCGVAVPDSTEGSQLWRGSA